MATVRRQGGIIQIHDNRITWLTENVSKTKYYIKHMEYCKKKSAHSKCCLKSEKMVKFCSKLKKCLRVLEM